MIMDQHLPKKVENLTKMAEATNKLSSALSIGKDRICAQQNSFTQRRPELASWQEVKRANEVNTAPPYVGIKFQMFLSRTGQEAPGLMLLNQQHQSYLHYVLIPSESEPFGLDKFVPEALPLLEAPPAVRQVHLYKLLCGVAIDVLRLQTL